MIRQRGRYTVPGELPGLHQVVPGTPQVQCRVWMCACSAGRGSGVCSSGRSPWPLPRGAVFGAASQAEVCSVQLAAGRVSVRVCVRARVCVSSARGLVCCCSLSP